MPDFFIDSHPEAKFSETEYGVKLLNRLENFDNFWHADVY